MTLRKFMFVIVAILSIWGLSGFLLYGMPDRGTFGDMFGAVNSLFSGLAFAAIIYTVALQRDELSLQRKELELTRGELQGQKKALEAQSEQMRLQSFEGTFFQMLKLHNDLLDSIDINAGGEVWKGRDSFARAWRRYRPKVIVARSQQVSERIELIRAAYGGFWDNYSNEFGHYFRSLYNIIKYIDNAQDIDKVHYANIVRAQISSAELVVIFYNCLCEEGEKFKPLIEKYALLKHLNRKDIMEGDAGLYAGTAFSRS